MHQLWRILGFVYLDAPGRKLGSLVIGSVGYFTYPINGGIPWGYNPLILTFDPNFQRDIHVVGVFFVVRNSTMVNHH